MLVLVSRNRSGGFLAIMSTKKHRGESARTIALNHGWVTKVELAKALRVCTKTIETWVRERRIPAYKIGRAIRFQLHEVEGALRAFRFEALKK